jgi:hypothetical protein
LGVEPGGGPFSTFLHTSWAFPVKKQKIVKCAKKNAILGILHKFQTAVLPKVSLLGIRANP